MKLPRATVSANDALSSMTPMIDVVFQLLIFFLCTASFQRPEQFLPTTLPATGASTFEPAPEVEELGLIRISLSQVDGTLHISLNGNACPDIATLRTRLEVLAAHADLPVVLDIAAAVELRHAVQVYDTCLLVGLLKINFAAPAQG